MNRSMRVSPVIIVGGVLLLVAAAAGFLLINKLQPTTQLFLGDGVFDARVAYTQAERERGLSGVENMKPTDALIFAYPGDDIWKIWMKDMKIPIDIVWLDSNKKVIYVVKDASPDGGTDVTFAPKVPARYVVELPAGTVDRTAIKPDKAAVFDIKQEDIR